MRRLTLLVSVLWLGQAQAQADEWNAFPTTTTPAPSPAPAPPPAPAPVATSPSAPAAAAQQSATSPPAAPAGNALTPLTSQAQPAPISVPSAATAPQQPASAPAAAGPGAPAAGVGQPLADGTIVSTRERFVPGTEPHSPATRGRAWNDPKNLRHTSAFRGNVGLLRLSSADFGPKGILRFSALGEYFAARDFPMAGAANTRTAGTFGFSATALDWLEFFGAYSASANTNSRSAPVLIQSLGDLTFGAKVATRLGGGVTVALDTRLQSFSGVGNQDVRRFAFGISPGGLLSWDLREAAALPARFHANVFGQFDGTRRLVQDTRVNAAEAFALGIHSYHRVLGGAGVELPLPFFTPFVEFNVAYPLNVESEGVLGIDGERYTALQVMPQLLGVGAKITAFKDVTFLAAAEFGLNRRVAVGVMPSPRFNLYFGASFNVDPLQKGETRVVETVLERKPEAIVAKPPPPAAPSTGKISGVVLDAKTRKPLAGVMVAPVGLPPVASEPESGRFLTHEIPSGLVKLFVKKDGYRDIAAELVLEAGKVANVELALEALKPTAKFALAVTGSKKPVAATAMFEGPVPQKIDTKPEEASPVPVHVEPGRYTVNVSAPGYLAQTREVQLSEGAEMALTFDLNPEPEKKLVIVKADKKKIQISEQVHFQTGKAVILEDSFSLLNQVVDAIVRANIKRVRIEGHTDNRGKKLVNLRLSQQRALSVAEYLTRQGGIDPRRIEAKGFGDSRPLAPNLTTRGRELNRRVEFIIVEQ